MPLASTLDTLAATSHAGRSSFGDFVAALAAAGVESYHADYRRKSTTFYLPDGATHTVHLPVPSVAIPEAFDGDAVVGAIRGAQAGDVSYPAFVARTMAAGCVGYHVWIAGRHVDYFGRAGQLHVEHFPTR